VLGFLFTVSGNLECEQFLGGVHLFLNSNPFYEADKGTAEDHQTGSQKGSGVIFAVLNHCNYFINHLLHCLIFRDSAFHTRDAPTHARRIYSEGNGARKRGQAWIPKQIEQAYPGPAKLGLVWHFLSLHYDTV